MQNQTSLKIILFSFILLSVSLISAQKGIKKMIKRSLDEKSFLKLTSIGDRQSNAQESEQAKLRFRNSEYGEKLVYDNEKGSESEVFAAINPVDSNNIVVGVIHFAYNPYVDKPLELSLYYTNDFGDTWVKSDFTGTINNSALNVGGGDPVLVYDKQGRLHLTYILLTTEDFITFKSKEYVYHAISSDNGKTWLAKSYFESTKFDPFTFEGINNFLDKQWMVADFTSSPFSGNVYMGYVDYNLKDTAINMMVEVIEPSDTFMKFHPVKVTSDSFKFVQYASIDLDNDGNLYLGFVGTYDSIQYSFFNCVSKDGGKTFSEPKKISDMYFPGFTGGSDKSTIVGVRDRYFPSPYIAIDKSSSINEGRIYATWTSPGLDTIDSGGSDIFLCYSDDRGIDWTKPIIVNNDSLANSDQFYSTLEVNSTGIPILTFYDKREDSLNYNTHYYITYSLDLDNLDFSTQYAMTHKASDFSKIGYKTKGFGIGEYNKIVSTEHFAIPFWSDGRKNTGDVNIYMARIPLDGIEHTVDVKNISIASDKITVNSISPNPSNGIFNISYTTKSVSKVTFDVFDISGKKVYKSSVPKQDQGQHITKLNLITLDKGLYILKITTKFGLISKSIIIN